MITICVPNNKTTVLYIFSCFHAGKGKPGIMDDYAKIYAKIVIWI